MKTKNLILSAILITLTSYGFATVRTVSNHPLGGAQYPDLESAYNAAANGDTLLIEGTPSSYHMGAQCVQWSKSLVVIGQGLNTEKQNFNRTYIRNSPNYYAGFCEFAIGSGGSGSRFYGINFNLKFIKIDNVSNITFENCMFDYAPEQYNLTNIVFKNCIFTGAGGASVKINSAAINMLFLSCIFNTRIEGNNSTNQFITVDHCLFLSNSNVFAACNGYTLKNSVFMNTTDFTGISNSTFESNICRLSSVFPPAGSIILGGNQNGVDPLFVTYTYGEPYSPSHVYHLQSGSPASGAGSDATDIGVHGGFTKFSETGEPLITPVMRSMNIENTTVAPNGTLHVQIVASKPHDE
jgi:hypothetical protein